MARTIDYQPPKPGTGLVFCNGNDRFPVYVPDSVSANYLVLYGMRMENLLEASWSDTTYRSRKLGAGKQTEGYRI